MRKLSITLGLVGIAVVSLSVHSLLTNANVSDTTAAGLQPAIKYVEAPLPTLALTVLPENHSGGGGGGGGINATKPPKTPVGGGCGSFKLLTFELTPIVSAPADRVKLGNTFLVGLRLSIQSATAERRQCIERRTSAGVELSTSPKAERVDIQAFSPDELKYLLDYPVKASLSLVGAEFSPKEPAAVSVLSPVYWSVRPASDGELRGHVKLETFRWNMQGEPEYGALHIGIDSVPEGQLFTAEVRSDGPSPTQVLSVIGSILGTLLASLPAWLAWFDKRRAAARDESKPKIILPQ